MIFLYFITIPLLKEATESQLDGPGTIMPNRFKKTFFFNLHFTKYTLLRKILKLVGLNGN